MKIQWKGRSNSTLLGRDSADRIMDTSLHCKGLGTFSLQCHSFVAIVRPEPIGRMVAVTRGSLVTFFIQGMNVNSHFFHYWHVMTVFILVFIIVVVVVKWSYFPRVAVSVYLRATNQAFPQCLWIKQQVSFPKLWLRLSPRDPHWRIILCPLNKYPHANFSDWSRYISLKNKLRKLFLKRSKQDFWLGYMNG